MIGCIRSVETLEESTLDEDNVLDSVVLEKSLYVVNEFAYSYNNECSYGSWYTLEVYNDERWMEFPYAYKGNAEIAWIKGISCE